MYKTLMLAIVLVASAAWLQAQAYPESQSNPASSSQATMPDQTSSNPVSSGQTTVQGCLQGSNGNYTLTDKNGTMYQLTGDTSKLADHVGHEVQITGSTSSSASSSGATAGSMSGSAGSQQSIDVKSVKHISKSCTSSPK